MRNPRGWKNSHPAFDHEKLRKEARDFRNQNLKLCETIESSEPVRNAENCSRQLISNTLYVGRISCRADAVKVVEVLAKAAAFFETDLRRSDMRDDITSSFYDLDLGCYDEKSFPILRCVLPNPPKGRRGGYYAFVTVANEEIKQRLLKLSTIYIYGEDLQIKEAQKFFYHDPTAFRSKIEAVQIGLPKFNLLTHSQQRSYNFMYDNIDHFDDLPWQYQWASDKESLATYLEINSLRKVIAFEFLKKSTNYRVELSMHHIEGGVRVEDDIQHNGRKAKVLVLLLKVPPAIFRSEGKTNTQISESYANTTAIPLLIKGIKNKLLWQLGSISGQDSKEWIRTVDYLSLNSCAFSRCLVYRVVLKPKSSRHILEYLRKFQLSGERLTKSIPISNCYPSNLNKYDGWSGYSSDKIFECLPFRIKYLIQCLVSQNRMTFVDDVVAKSFLEKILENKLLSLCALVEMEKHWNQLSYLNPTLNLEVWMKSYIHDHDVDDIFKRGIYVRTVTITPLRVICHAPQLSHSNRVLREYPELRERLVRATFADEALGPFYKAKSNDILQYRMRRLLRRGINIVGRSFRFLAYSNSQLRTISCWMYDETPAEYTSVPNVDDLRKKLGNFDSFLPSRFGARLGQCFSDILIANEIESSQWKVEDDIIRNGWCFSDGVGKISRRLSAKVATEMGYGYIPSAFQIRFAGFKGILTQYEMPSDLGNDSIDIVFRKSMKKFESPSQYLEVSARSLP